MGGSEKKNINNIEEKNVMNLHLLLIYILCKHADCTDGRQIYLGLLEVLEG